MKLTREAVKERGGHIGPPIKRKVEWTDGNTGELVEADVWVRRLSYYSLVTDSQHVTKQDKGGIIASRIATAIVDEEGWPIFTEGDILGIDDEGNPTPDGPISSELAGNLYRLVHEVSKLGKLPSPANSG